MSPTLTYKYPYTVKREVITTLTKLYLQSPSGERFWIVKDYYVNNLPPRDLAMKYGHTKRLISEITHQVSASPRMLHNDVAKIITAIEKPLTRHRPFVKRVINSAADRKVECVCGAEFRGLIIPGMHILTKHRREVNTIVNELMRYVEV